jgi:exopolysaccharide biosynthesis protein
MRIASISLLALVPLLAGEQAARAEAPWEEIQPGVEYQLSKKRIKGKPVRFHTIKIHLEQSGAEIVVSPPGYIGKRTSHFARDIGAHAAVNGGFWKLVTHDPLGLVVTAGKRWPRSRDDEKYGFFAVTSDGRVWISPPEKRELPSKEETHMAISGYPMIVRDGQTGKVRGCGYICTTGPRTALGVDESRSTLFLVVVDGRQDRSAGTNLVHLAEHMIEMGVWNALNLDGGGSSTLYVEAMGGTVNTPSEGRERAVLNSLGVFFHGPTEPRPEEESGVEEGVVGAAAAVEREERVSVHFERQDFEVRGAPEPPLLLRRILQASGGAVLLLALVAGSVVIVRIRRKRRSRPR